MRPYRSVISAAVPLATTRPAERNTTRSQSRSTSTMLWLVTSSAVPRSSDELAQARAHAQRDVRVERGGRLVEHEQPRAVHGRLDDADERLLAAGQLGAHGLGEVGDAEALEAGAGGGVRAAQPVEPAEQA